MPKGFAHALAFVLVTGGIFLAWINKSPGHRADGLVGDVETVAYRLQTGAAHDPVVSEDGIDIYFSPRGGCEAAIVKELNLARTTIDMQAYEFTSQPISHALVAAQARGVHVRAVLDRKATTENPTEAMYVKDGGVTVFIDGQYPIAHNKVMIIDSRTVITGSFNFTHQAEAANAENLLIIHGKLNLAGAYERNFEQHLGHSQPY